MLWNSISRSILQLRWCWFLPVRLGCWWFLFGFPPGVWTCDTRLADGTVSVASTCDSIWGSHHRGAKQNKNWIWWTAYYGRHHRQNLTTPVTTYHVPVSETTTHHLHGTTPFSIEIGQSSKLFQHRSKTRQRRRVFTYFTPHFSATFVKISTQCHVRSGHQVRSSDPTTK